VILLNGPVKEIVSVTLTQSCGATQTPITDWCLNTAWSVNLCCSSSSGYSSNPAWNCGCSDTAVRIDYHTQSILPPGTQGQLIWLAEQYVKAASGKACALPERVTNISRQGVSWSLLDPQDFLDKRYTGTRLDQWLMTARAVYPPSRLIDPLKSCRLFSEKLSCGEAPFVEAGEYGYGTYGDGLYGYGTLPPSRRMFA